MFEKNSRNRWWWWWAAVRKRLSESIEAKKLASGSKERGRRVGSEEIRRERERLVIGSGGGGIDGNRRRVRELGCSERHFSFSRCNKKTKCLNVILLCGEEEEWMNEWGVIQVRCYISETKVKWRRGGGNEGVGLGDNRPQCWGDFAYVYDYMCKFISYHTDTTRKGCHQNPNQLFLY